MLLTLSYNRINNIELELEARVSIFVSVSFEINQEKNLNGRDLLTKINCEEIGVHFAHIVQHDESIFSSSFQRLKHNVPLEIP